jgi:hypothetical protein
MKTTSLCIRATFKGSGRDAPVHRAVRIEPVIPAETKIARAQTNATPEPVRVAPQRSIHQNRPVVELRRAMDALNVSNQTEAPARTTVKRAAEDGGASGRMTRVQRDELEVAQSYRPEMEQQGLQMRALEGSGVVVRRSARAKVAPERYIDTYGYEIFKRYTLNNKGEVDVDPGMMAVLMEEYNTRKRAADLRKIGKVEESRAILQRLEQSRMRAAALALESDRTTASSAAREVREEAEDAQLERAFVETTDGSGTDKRRQRRRVVEEEDEDSDYVEPASEEEEESESEEEEEDESEDDDEEEDESEEEEDESEEEEEEDDESESEYSDDDEDDD